MRLQFLTFLNEQHLFEPTDSVLLAVSGGLDSVVMVDLFRAAGFNYGIAHVNFGLRGPESDGDENFVRTLAEQSNIPFYTTRFDTARIAAEDGISIQMAARNLRYAWFDEIATAFNYQWIATAHHLDDSLETLLLNLVRGTGLAGLRGIPLRTGRVVRPLWATGRAEIEQYARTYGLNWREDSSNQSDTYYRNRLRHHVIPVFKELNPRVLQSVQQLFEAVRATEVLSGEELQRSWQALAGAHPGGVWTVPLARLTELTEWPYRLAEWLRPFGFRYGQTGPVADAVRAAHFGQVFESGTHRLLRDREALWIYPRQSDPAEPVLIPAVPAADVPVNASLRLRFETFDRPEDFIIPTDAAVACLDADRISGPLTIRLWQPGDRFRPLGAGGSQTVGDFLTNRKVPLADRTTTRVLLSGSDIAWLIGYRPDDRFRLTEQTRRVLRVTVLPGNEGV